MSDVPPLNLIVLFTIGACLSSSASSLVALVWPQGTTTSSTTSSTSSTTSSTRSTSSTTSGTSTASSGRIDFMNGLIRNRAYGTCLANDGRGFYFGACTKGDPQQSWTYDTKNIKHVNSGQCLSGIGSGATFLLQPCDPKNPLQQFTYDKPTFVQKSSSRCMKFSNGTLLFADCNKSDSEMAFDNLGEQV